MIKLFQILSEININKPIKKRFNAYHTNLKTAGGFKEYWVDCLDFPNFDSLGFYGVLDGNNMVSNYNPTLSIFLDNDKIEYEKFTEDNKEHIAIPIRYFNLK